MKDIANDRHSGIRDGPMDKHELFFDKHRQIPVQFLFGGGQPVGGDQTGCRKEKIFLSI